MSKRKRDLSEEERSLWKRVTERVKPRRAPPKTSEKKEAPPKPARPAPPVAAPAPERPAPLTRASAKPPADRGGEKRVRRGKLDVAASLDLHGHTQESARAALIRFLQSAQRRGDRTVIVITGVGRAGGGVLRQRLPEWLGDRQLRSVTSGYAQAHRSHGGAGAYYVFLKNRAD